VSLPRPPADISTREFFERWLPQTVTLAATPAARPAIADPHALLVRIEVQGPGGGLFLLRAAGETLTPVASDGGAAAGGGEPDFADVTIIWSEADFRAFALGEGGERPMVPRTMNGSELLFAAPQTRELILMLRGVLRFEIAGMPGGRTFAATVAFGRGTPTTRPLSPHTTIALDRNTYRDLLTGRVNPVQAYFEGRIQLHGDVNLGMQLGMAMLPLFARPARRPA
jgi:hypothetical protein